MVLKDNIVLNGNDAEYLIDSRPMGTKRINLTNVEKITDIVRKEILSYMKEEGLSQYGVAKTCGWTPSYVIQILGSKGVSLNKLFEIASKIGMKLTLLIEKKS